MALTTELDFIILAIHLVVGFTLVYFSMKAFKKTHYPPMAYLAIGFGLIVIADTLIGDLFEAFGSEFAELFEEIIEIVGFILLILAVKRS